MISGAADLVLVRHAPTSPVSGIPPEAWSLAPGAMEESAALGFALAKLRLEREGAPSGPGIDAVVASRELKAMATARSLAHVLGAEIGTAPGLEEHHRTAGQLLERSDFERTVRRFFASPDTLVFGEETAREAEARFRDAVVAVMGSRPAQRLAIVSHGTVLTLLLAAANGLDPFSFWSSLSMPEALVVSSSDWRILERIKLEA